MAKAKIVLKIRAGNIEAEGVDFKGKACKDKMAFLKKIGQVVAQKDKEPTAPEPGPNVYMHKG